jgi:3-hydroxyisobutyrate dehydrogenase-like beta-hydroxyacid dehydrogenase
MNEEKQAPDGVALIGFGEAGQAFARGWRSRGPLAITAYDIKTDAPSGAIRSAKQADYAKADVRGCATLAEALAGASFVFSLVTASEANAAARAAAASLAPGALFFDCNSCAPQTKAGSAAIVEAAGGRYVDVAVMAPVHPKLHHVPLLVSGPHGEAALAALSALDMQAEMRNGPVG